MNVGSIGWANRVAGARARRGSKAGPQAAVGRALDHAVDHAFPEA